MSPILFSDWAIICPDTLHFGLTEKYVIALVYTGYFGDNRCSEWQQLKQQIEQHAFCPFRTSVLLLTTRRSCSLASLVLGSKIPVCFGRNAAWTMGSQPR